MSDPDDNELLEQRLVQTRNEWLEHVPIWVVIAALVLNVMLWWPW